MNRTSVHLIQKSPFGCDALDACIRVCADSDSIVLMNDAVYAAALPRIWPTKNVYALTDDMASRGITVALAAGILSIDYKELVELCSQHPHSQSWF
ncbi:MAG: tRNA 2-thiouridine synthesizing protein B [Bermanella sp.]|jgi:tRNA 2-thiouridine synthesizing protein B